MLSEDSVKSGVFVFGVEVNEVQLDVSLRAEVYGFCSELPKGQLVPFQCAKPIDKRMHEVHQISFGKGIACKFLFGDGLGEGEVVEGAIGVDHSVYDAKLLVCMGDGVPSFMTAAWIFAKFLCSTYFSFALWRRYA